MKACMVCLVEKDESEFVKHRFGLSSTCRRCATEAKESLKVKPKYSSGTSTLDLVVNSRREPQKRFIGAIQKRCPECNGNIFVDRTWKTYQCWKCDSVLKIREALRDTDHHRGGIILEVVR